MSQGLGIYKYAFTTFRSKSALKRRDRVFDSRLGQAKYYSFKAFFLLVK